MSICNNTNVTRRHLVHGRGWLYRFCLRQGHVPNLSWRDEIVQNWTFITRAFTFSCMVKHEIYHYLRPDRHHLTLSSGCMPWIDCHHWRRKRGDIVSQKFSRIVTFPCNKPVILQSRNAFAPICPPTSAATVCHNFSIQPANYCLDACLGSNLLSFLHEKKDAIAVKLSMLYLSWQSSKYYMEKFTSDGNP